MTETAHSNSTALFWGTDVPTLRDNLADWLTEYRWHYSITITDAKPRVIDWIPSFIDSINTLDIFPCGKRFTDEPPGVLPIRYRDTSGIDTLTIMIAMPPGALREFMAAYERVRVVFERAARITFIESKSRVRPTTPLQIESLLEGIDDSDVEFATLFLREHHRSCPEPDETT